MKKLLVILIVSAFILPGCKVFDFLKKDKTEEKVEVTKNYQIKVPVITSKAVKTDLIKYIKTNGIAKASGNAVVYSELAGSISKLLIEENQIVKKGELIIEIDCRDLELQLEEATLTYKKALAEYNAWKKLENSGTEEQLKIQTGLSEAEIQVEKIHLSIDKAKIRAPFDGVVTNIIVDRGEQVSAGTHLFTIINNDEIIIKGQVLESELHRVKQGAKARIRFAAIPEDVIEARKKLHQALPL